MANSKTWTARILNAASKETTVNNRTLRVRFRIPKTEMDQTSFNNTIGRTTRYMAEAKLLKRTGRGEYKITAKGTKALANA